jgi:3-(3-hydroxy-phenyl)propionate hydroxylase
MRDIDVVIAGAGPTGLVLAGELALAGVEVALVERRPDQDLVGSRAGGLHPRTLEVFDQRGIADRFVREGRKHPIAPFGETMLDVSDLATRHPYWLGLWQNRIEHILAGWIEELAVPVHRGCEVTDFVQDKHGVEVALADGRTLRAKYLVGCDGGRSRVRKTVGIGFPGYEATVSCLIFEADMAEEPPWGIRYGDKGVNALGRLDDGPRVRGVVAEPQRVQGDTPDPAELQATLRAAYGTDFGVHDVTWLSRFTDAARLAETYRKGRVLLAGDAAHIHSPAGGQGLNIGVRDAVNLGWKLALAVKGAAPDSLLDSYHAERHPVGERLLRNTMALSALQRGDDGTRALRDMMSEAMQTDAARHWYAAMISGLDTRYTLGEGHPLLGRRMPDLDLVTADGAVRVSTLLQAGRPLLLDLTGAGDAALAPGDDRARYVKARCDGPWILPVLGPVEPPGAVLVRPDGHVAWTGARGGPELDDALATWFGPPAAA